MTHYVYIHGFGDSYNWLRRIALRRWRRRDVRVTFVPMDWKSKSETFEQKYERIVSVFDASDEKTVLVGESAGGAMALLVYIRQKRRSLSVVTVCGYNHTASDIWQVHRRGKPAFYPLVKMVDELLLMLASSHRKNVRVLYGRSDRSVATKYSQIDGARMTRLPTRGHFVSIGYVLFKGPRVLRNRETEARGV